MSNQFTTPVYNDAGEQVGETLTINNYTKAPQTEANTAKGHLSRLLGGMAKSNCQSR